MRGRLIQKFIAILERLDPVATSAVVGGGYDNVFDEPIPVDDGTQVGSSSIRYMASIRLPVQLDRQTWGKDDMARGGHKIQADILFIFHWPDLVNAGLIDSSGEPMIQKGDRIAQIETLNGDIERTWADPPGMFVKDLERAGHGLAAFGTPQTNLLIVYGALGEASE